MFEKEAKEWVTANTGFNPKEPLGKIAVRTYLAGLKAGKDMNVPTKWHKVADGDLPKDDIKLAIIEIDDCGYLLCNYRNGFWYDANSGATCAEWITNNVYAWKEIVFPKESE